MRQRTKSREYAFKILYQGEVGNFSAEDSIATFWRYHKDTKPVREFANILVRGAAEHKKELDGFIMEYAENWRLERMAVVDRNILRLAAYELLFFKETPPKVVINEAIDIAKRYGDTDSGAFVNGILDRIRIEESQDKEPAK